MKLGPFVLLGLMLMVGCSTTRIDNPNYSPLKASEANAQLGLSYLQRGMLDQSKLKLEKAIDQNPRNAKAISGYGMLKARLRQPEQAEEQFRRALEIEPDNSEILNYYGTFLCDQNRIDEARDRFLQAARNPLYTTPEFAYSNLGTCLLGAGRKEEAKLQFIAALHASPKFAPALFRLAELQLESDEAQIAASYLERYHQVAKQTPESLWLAVQAYKKLDDRGQVASYALKLKRRFPNSPQAAALTEFDKNE